MKWEHVGGRRAMWGERARPRGGRSVFPVGSGRTLPPRSVRWHRDTKEAGSERTGREEGPGTQGLLAGGWQPALRAAVCCTGCIPPCEHAHRRACGATNVMPLNVDLGRRTPILYVTNLQCQRRWFLKSWFDFLRRKSLPKDTQLVSS